MSTIRGSVFQDLNANGIFDLGEGLSNVTVFLDIDGNGVPATDGSEPVLVTDLSGEYIFADLPAGTFTLDQVTIPGFDEPIGVPLALTVTGDVNERLDVNIVNFNPTVVNPIPTTGIIRGAVFFDVDRNRLFDPFNEPTFAEGFPEIEVYIDLDNSGFRELSEPTTTVNNAGFYEFVDLPPGQYLLRTIEPSGFEQTTDSNPAVVGVLAGAATDADIGLINPNSIFGRVIRDLNGNGLPEPTEPGQPGIVVEEAKSGKSTTTNSEGYYIISGLDTEIDGADDPQNPYVQFISRVDPERFAQDFVIDFIPPSTAYAFTSPIPPVGLIPGEIGVPVVPERTQQVNSTLVFTPAGGSVAVPNSISGTVFNDFNADSLLNVDPITGLQDTPLSDVTLFIDLDDDGVLGGDEPSTTSDINGNFIFTNLSPTLPIDPVTGFTELANTYVVRAEGTEDQPNLTTPIAAITLDSGEAAQVAIGLSTFVPFPPDNQFAEAEGGIDPDSLIPVRGFPPAPIAPAPII